MVQSKEPKVYLPSDHECSLVSDDPAFREKFIEHNIENGRVIACDSPESADIIIIFQKWSFKLPDYVKALCAEPLIRNHAEKIYVVNYDSTVREGFLPGCYVSLQRSHYDPKRFVPSSYPKVYNELINDALLSRETKYLFSFRGTLHSHPVRPELFNALRHSKSSLLVDNTKAFHSHTKEEKEVYLEELAQSKFVLCPRGTSPNSYRLFETMQLGRCPIIISDEWVAPTGPKWEECSIRIKEADVNKIETILNEREGEAQRLGANAREAWLAYFSEEQTYRGYFESIRKLYCADEPITKTFPQYQSYWNSYQFLHRNNWTLKQKIVRRLKTWSKRD